jgi:hypothetical protein
MRNGKHENESGIRRYKGRALLSSAHLLEGKIPSRRDDLISIGLLMIYLVDELPYEDLFLQFVAGDPRVCIKKVLEAKLKCQPEDYCRTSKLRGFLEYMEEAMALKYDEEPFYSKLKFLLTKQLLFTSFVPCPENALHP